MKISFSLVIFIVTTNKPSVYKLTTHLPTLSKNKQTFFSRRVHHDLRSTHWTLTLQYSPSQNRSNTHNAFQPATVAVNTNPKLLLKVCVFESGCSAANTQHSAYAVRSTCNKLLVSHAPNRAYQECSGSAGSWAVNCGMIALRKNPQEHAARLKCAPAACAVGKRGSPYIMSHTN